MGPNKTFLLRIVVEVQKKEIDVAKIIQEGLPPSPSNPTHYYVGNEGKDKFEEELSQENPPIQSHISAFLRLS